MNKFLSAFFFFFVGCAVFINEAIAVDSYYINPVAFVVNRSGEETLSFPMKKPVPYKVFTLKAPPRLVLDFPGGVYRGAKQKIIGESGLVRMVRSASHKDPAPKTRIVVDLQPGRVVGHRLFFDNNKGALQLVLSGGKTAPVTGKEEAMPVKNIQVTGKKEVVAVQSTAVEETQRPAPKIMAQKRDQVVQSTENAQKDAEKIEMVVSEIRFIDFDASKPGEERVRFRLSGFYPPKISTREEQLPQVICDFPETILARDIEGQIVTGGNLVQRINVEKEKNVAGVRVVLELAQGKDFDLQQIFFRDDNIFVLVVREFVKERGW